MISTEIAKCWWKFCLFLLCYSDFATLDTLYIATQFFQKSSFHRYLSETSVWVHNLARSLIWSCKAQLNIKAANSWQMQPNWQSKLTTGSVSFYLSLSLVFALHTISSLQHHNVYLDIRVKSLKKDSPHHVFQQHHKIPHKNVLT